MTHLTRALTAGAEIRDLAMLGRIETKDGRDIREQRDDPRTSVVDGDCRSWDIPNLWVCDGSVFPTTGGVNPSLTIQAVALRTADRIKAMARGGRERRD